MIWLLIIFILIPAIEVGLFIWSSSHLGIIPVVLIILLTGMAGIALWKQQGAEIWRRAQLSIQRQEVPADEILDGISIIIGGIFLITPGFFTDTVGLLMVLPWTRKPFKHLINLFLLKQFAKGRFLFRRW